MSTPSIARQWRHVIFTTALEGGINYWAVVRNYRWSDGQGNEDYDGYNAVLAESDQMEDAHVTWLTVDDAVMARGLKLAQTTHRDRICWSCERPPLVFGKDTDWDYDAGDADCILQLGLFGEVVYG